ncbi:hypothetical protein [Tahibacter amnicola]|uniref:Uncharacterized protein n=1 Tax=Tahibacter amnicola TaxID=2976241 RepID=A0ABY6BD26_9GAMM|nr:hypothetical protein [Tahibacter amnicola]UXI67432.1 hypothetical protein N4264_22275 [Tahibacter amnicola]
MKSLSSLLLSSLFALCTPAALAAPGDYDPSFGTGGYTVTYDGDHSSADDLVVDEAGNVYTAGTSVTGGTVVPVLAKYKPNGLIDGSFGVGGIVTPASLPPNVAAYSALTRFRGYLFQMIAADDKLYVYAFNTSGVPQAWFGAGGVATFTVGTAIYPVFDIAQWGNNLAMAASARNPATGNHDFVLVGLSLSGAPLGGFGTGGVAYSRLWSGAGARNRLTGLVFQPDGRIVAAGRAAKPGDTYDFVVGRYQWNGTPDPTFGLAGFTRIGFADDDFGRRVALKKSGQIVISGSTCKTIDPAAGTTYCRAGAAQLRPNGALDATFGVGGKIEWDLYDKGVTVTDMILDDAERPVIVGQHLVDDAKSTAFVLRLKPDGWIDGSYGSGSGWVDLHYGYDANANGGVKLYKPGLIVTAGTTIKFADPSLTLGAMTVARHQN